MIKKFLYLAIFATILSASDTVSIGGLQWQDDSEAKSIKRSWRAALSYCEELSLSGKNDWRLPSIKELQGIVDIKRYDPAIKKDFKNVASKGYWSSSPGVSDSKYAWDVYFRVGDTDNDSKSLEYYVRCVRGRQ